MDCQCNKCKQACQHKPGWFLPGEAEKVAEHFGVSLQELFFTRLVVDYWIGDSDIFILSPGLRGREPGAVLPYDPRGECVFFTDDSLCEIHAVKPHECSCTLACQEGGIDLHEETAMAWREHQGQVVDLLGEEPEATGGTFGALELLMTGL